MCICFDFSMVAQGSPPANKALPLSVQSPVMKVENIASKAGFEPPLPFVVAAILGLAF